MSETKTRKLLIDNHLQLAGWNVDDYTQVVEEYATMTKVSEPTAAYATTFSEYVLLGKDEKPIAVVEAKKTSKDAEIGREQAKQYCQDIEVETGTLPFCPDIKCNTMFRSGIVAFYGRGYFFIEQKTKRLKLTHIILQGSFGRNVLMNCRSHLTRNEVLKFMGPKHILEIFNMKIILTKSQGIFGGSLKIAINLIRCVWPVWV